MLRVAITGHAQSGKDTAAGYIKRELGLMHINFADELKKDLIKLDPIIDPYYGIRVSQALVIHDGNLETIKKAYPEWRELCQRYGTNVRRTEDPDIWVDRLVDQVYELISMEGRLLNGYVVADMRFPNERNDILWNATIRIERPGVGPANDHVAESYIDTMPVDHVIVNDGTLEEFERKVLDVVELILRTRDDDDEEEAFDD